MQWGPMLAQHLQSREGRSGAGGACGGRCSYCAHTLSRDTVSPDIIVNTSTQADGSLTPELVPDSCRWAGVSVGLRGPPCWSKCGSFQQEGDRGEERQRRVFEFGHGQAVHRPTPSGGVHCSHGRDVTVLEAVRGGVRLEAGAVCL